MTLANVISHDDESAWQEARRPVITATQIRDYAKGYPSDRARLLIEKVTGVREDLSEIKYIEWGKFREPFLQDWVQQKYGIDPVANDLYVSNLDPRWACTPDGYSDSFGVITLSELKTSKHDLDPEGGTYLQTGYDDQIQWEMFVTGAEETLFVWEQHDDVWDPWPTPYPPKAVWIKRNDVRIKVLHNLALDFLADVADWQTAYDVMLAKCVTDDERIAAETALIEHIRADYTHTHGLEDRWLFIVGGDKLPADSDPLAVGELPTDLAELAAIVVEARAEEAAATKRKTEAWKKIQELTKEHTDFKAYGAGYAVSWSTSRGTRTVVDTEAMKEKARTVVERYEKLRERFTSTEPTESHTLIVTKQD